MTEALYPLLFTPVYKDYLWGGDKIIRQFDRDAPEGVYAESWEVSDRDDGMSIVRNGALAGRSLHQVVQTLGPALLGTKVKSDAFPLLIKLIDSRERLSVQVHPNDETAAKYGGQAKTEMWYILDADPGAGVFAGLEPGVDADGFQEAMRTKRFRDILTRVDVATGDAIFIPGGLVHAIDAGCLLLEVQQNSNTTYRIYDWDRVGKDGKPRPLHIQEALQVVRWDLNHPAKVSPRALEPLGSNERWLVSECRYFRLERIRLAEALTVNGRGESFVILFVAEGSARIEWGGGSEVLRPGTTCLVPAALADGRILPETEHAEVLRVSVS